MLTKHVVTDFLFLKSWGKKILVTSPCLSFETNTILSWFMGKRKPLSCYVHSNIAKCRHINFYITAKVIILITAFTLPCEQAPVQIPCMCVCSWQIKVILIWFKRIKKYCNFVLLLNTDYNVVLYHCFPWKVNYILFGTWQKRASGIWLIKNWSNTMIEYCPSSLEAHLQYLMWSLGGVLQNKNFYFHFLRNK